MTPQGYIIIYPNIQLFELYLITEVSQQHEISSELFLLRASSVRIFAAERASLTSLIASTAS